MQYQFWVNMLGHIALWSWKQEEERGLFRDGEVSKVWIPPSSVFIANGYIPHAGASFEESNNQRSLRYHMYFYGRKGTSCPMVFHMLDNYGPAFIDSADEDEDDMGC